jgi:serine O-acetyltransferase
MNDLSRAKQMQVLCLVYRTLRRCADAHSHVTHLNPSRDTSMREVAAELRTLDQIATLLTEHQSCCPGAGHAAPLPSVKGVVSIVRDLWSLLFPGVHPADGVSFIPGVNGVRQQLRPIQTRLNREIARALEHSQQVQLRLHNEKPQSSFGTYSYVPAATVLTTAFLSRLPELQQTLASDVAAAFNGDPAAKTPEEIVLCYPGIEAITVYRIAHELLLLGVPYLPRIMTEWAHRETGIDIHPGAKIGGSFFIDHGTGVVIGETCEIGSQVTLYQGVTLGAWSFPRDDDGNLIRGTKRHPTLEDRVTVYSNATILGGTTVVGAGSLIGSSVTLNRSIPPNTIVTIEKPSLKFREAA